MYLPSNTPLLADQRANAARAGACSDQRIATARQMSAAGRVALFNTLISPAAVNTELGTGAAVNAAKLQAQTQVSRAVGLLGTSGGQAQPSMADIVAGAPEVVSLNRGVTCAQRLAGESNAVPLGPDPTPGMPHRAPRIEQGPNGPMYFRGADATVDGTYPSRGGSGSGSGLTGYAPAWSDAWVMDMAGSASSNDVGVVGWMQAYPWVILAAAAAGAYALSRRGKR